MFTLAVTRQDKAVAVTMFISEDKTMIAFEYKKLHHLETNYDFGGQFGMESPLHRP